MNDVEVKEARVDEALDQAGWATGNVTLCVESVGTLRFCMGVYADAGIACGAVARLTAALCAVESIVLVEE